MKIAVIGGGIFGCTTAIHAARAGYEVDLFEAHGSLLQSASGINQFRLHRGYHYPRSPETARECQVGLDSFREEYDEAVIDGERHLYAIAKEGSKVSARDYLKFCDNNNLPYKIVERDNDEISLLIEAEESRISPGILRRIVGQRLAGLVNVHRKTMAPPTLRQDFDMIVVAAYASTNQVTDMLGCVPGGYQFEICEKPVVSLPFGKTGMVVMDGEFGCIDPFDHGLYLLGHVKHAIHHSNIGIYPEVPHELLHLIDYLDHGIIRKPPVTNFKDFIEAGVKFIPELEKAKHVGSMFTIRAVLANRDDTDERPTIVDRLDDQVIRVFSGKIGTAVVAARQVISILEDREKASSVSENIQSVHSHRG